MHMYKYNIPGVHSQSRTYAINAVHLDSSRERASFETNIFEKFTKKKWNFYLRKLWAQKKLLDEKNPTVQNSSP
jgi:hypothetical protein